MLVPVTLIPVSSDIFGYNSGISIGYAPSDKGFCVHKYLHCRRLVIENVIAVSPYGNLLESPVCLSLKGFSSPGIIGKFPLVYVVSDVFGDDKGEFKIPLFYSDIPPKQNVVL
jgi:hypothetical protein